MNTQNSDLDSVFSIVLCLAYHVYVHLSVLLSTQSGHLKFLEQVESLLGFPDGAGGKEPTCQCRKHKRHWFDTWVETIPQRRAWQPTPVFSLENPVDRGAWWATVHRAAKSLTRVRQLSTHTYEQERRGRTLEGRVQCLYTRPHAILNRDVLGGCMLPTELQCGCCPLALGTLV